MAKLQIADAPPRNPAVIAPCYKYPMRLFVLSLFAFCLSAQVAPVGSLVGEVKDSSGAVVAGAGVTLTNSGTMARKQTTTNAEGRFAFQLLPVGSYQLHVTA